MIIKNGVLKKVYKKEIINGTVKIPKEVTSGALKIRNNLRKIPILKKITSIGFSTSHNYSSLAEIEISKKVTHIGDYAFNNCSSLREIEIP